MVKFIFDFVYTNGLLWLGTVAALCFNPYMMMVRWQTSNTLPIAKDAAAESMATTKPLCCLFYCVHTRYRRRNKQNEKHLNNLGSSKRCRAMNRATSRAPWNMLIMPWSPSVLLPPPPLSFSNYALGICINVPRWHEALIRAFCFGVERRSEHGKQKNK